MSIYKVKEKQSISSLFDGWEETMIYSYLQGYMGEAYADSLDNPKSAQIIVGDFIPLAGEVNEELIRNLPFESDGGMKILVGQNDSWNTAIEKVYKERAEKITRYAIKKEPDVFDEKKLKEIASSVPEGFELSKINREYYDQIMKMPWAIDFCSNFNDYEEYEKKGLGVVAIHNGKVVSGASSYTVYDKGIEIEIDTELSYRRRRLGIACAAQLILECLDRGWYPSWDAMNKESLALSQKLGYHFSHEYVSYIVRI